MLTAITDEKKIRDCNRQLARELKKYITAQPARTIIFPQGSYDTNVNYSTELELWWCFNYAGEGDSLRHWNAFGIDDVRDHPKLRIACEINMPVKGINLRVAGLWATDVKGHRYLLHNGKIGGGTRGVGKSLFLAHFKYDDLQEVDLHGRVRKYVLVTQLGSATLGREIAFFVHEVYRIKALARAINKEQTTLDAYTPEFSGIKKYALPDEVTIDSHHGLVVDALKKELERRGLRPYRNQYIDLFTKKKSKVAHLFEIKTQLSRQWVYTAVGQLMINGLATNDQPHLYFVCPSDIKPILVRDLAKIKINVITYSRTDEIIVFTNLDTFF